MCSVIMFQISMPFPEGGLMYDYSLDDGGASRIREDEEEEEKKKTKVRTYPIWRTVTQ